MVDLKEMFGKRYRVTLDESYYHENESGKESNKWAYYEIVGRYGTLYPYSKSELAVYFKSNQIRNKVVRGLKCLQNGQEESTYLLPSDKTHLVLDAIKPRKRRILSDSQLERLRIASQPYRYRKKNTVVR